MPKADSAFVKTLHRIVLIQSTILIIVAVLSSLVEGLEFTIALLYGGAVTIVITLYSGWRLSLATQSVAGGPTLDMVEFYKGVLLRFVLAIALLALGMGVLGLTPMAVMIGFITTQVAYFFVRGYAPRRRG